MNLEKLLPLHPAENVLPCLLFRLSEKHRAAFTCADEGTEEPPDSFKAGCKHLLGTVAVKLFEKCLAMTKKCYFRKDLCSIEGWFFLQMKVQIYHRNVPVTSYNSKHIPCFSKAQANYQGAFLK